MQRSYLPTCIFKDFFFLLRTRSLTKVQIYLTLRYTVILRQRKVAFHAMYQFTLIKTIILIFFFFNVGTDLFFFILDFLCILTRPKSIFFPLIISAANKKGTHNVYRCDNWNVCQKKACCQYL